MGHRTDREAFGAYISDLRNKRKYALEQVCEGLCTAQRLFQLEAGNQSAGKLLQDAILERLGVGAEDYEHYLHYREYDQWEMRQRIQHRISCGNAVRAKELLKEYCGCYGGDFSGSGAVGDRLERQFYLSMWAQIRCMEGAERGEGVVPEGMESDSGSGKVQGRRRGGSPLPGNPDRFGGSCHRWGRHGKDLSQSRLFSVWMKQKEKRSSGNGAFLPLQSRCGDSEGRFPDVLSLGIT